ncbi:MAG: hypothetical protein HRT53_07875 [Colwellia sp.]|nr:hypothetical protein [Colwellia sp.]
MRCKKLNELLPLSLASNIASSDFWNKPSALFVLLVNSEIAIFSGSDLYISAGYYQCRELLKKKKSKESGY